MVQRTFFYSLFKKATKSVLNVVTAPAKALAGGVRAVNEGENPIFGVIDGFTGSLRGVPGLGYASKWVGRSVKGVISSVGGLGEAVLIEGIVKPLGLFQLAVGEIINPLRDMFDDIIQGLVDALGDASTGGRHPVSAVIKGTTDTVKNIPLVGPGAKWFGDGADNFFSGVGDAGETMFGGMIGAYNGMNDAMGNAATSAGSVTHDWFTGAGDTASKIGDSVKGVVSGSGGDKDAAGDCDRSDFTMEGLYDMMEPPPGAAMDYSKGFGNVGSLHGFIAPHGGAPRIA